MNVNISNYDAMDESIRLLRERIENWNIGDVDGLDTKEELRRALARLECRSKIQTQIRTAPVIVVTDNIVDKHVENLST